MSWFCESGVRLLCGLIPSRSTYRRAWERSIPISSARCFSDTYSSATGSLICPTNDSVNVAAASNRCFQDRRDPPLTFNRLMFCFTAAFPYSKKAGKLSRLRPSEFEPLFVLRSPASSCCQHRRKRKDSPRPRDEQCITKPFDRLPV